MNEPRPDRRRHMGHVIAVEPLPEAFANPEHRPFNHEAIDFPQIKEWIEYCDKNHLQRCKPEKFTLPPNFKVIDCREPEDINREEPTVVSVGDDCEYAALSYVWGNIEDKFPQVVKDSIKVARQLKCEYLWVDRLCINQDPKDPNKQEQIKKMDAIYSRAIFTIIAAAGTNCNSGLAGITFPRISSPKQRCVQVDGVKLTYVGTPAAEKIQSSTWGSRGWTYQEGLLSHRRIYFTNEQVIFQCNNMTCLESFAIPMDVLHRLDIPNTKLQPVLKDTEPLFLPLKDIGKHLMEFSKRNFSHDRETLDAFLGVLNACHREEGYFHFLGNPLIRKKKGWRWLINAWYHVQPGARKADFPSWSWTGWKGEITMTSYDTPDHDIRLLREDGCSISLDDYRTEYNTNPPQPMKPVIQLEGMMTMMSFELIKWGSETTILNRTFNQTVVQDGPWAILPLTTGITCYSFLYLDNEAMTGLYQFELPIMVLEFGIESRDHNIIILVLREEGDLYERVGMVTIRGGFESNIKNGKAPAKLTMYKDKSRGWMTRVPISNSRDCIWQKDLEKKTIMLQ
ncbi:related to tol protein [Fusarium fujikuroi IMI 58289]|uniref:Related to tol protein n=1 Tax=Gibberella fujikuroi (strain CBS 195.34 / IMI 58289 / NRRL A-6831) TaxID=1279085 RepID=S0EA36_GIBF5|nr:related to tol protein [Fusarium fujikuroi IMI 58289]KLP19232.1 tol protein [Fusarium fujikuroi]CCT70592.1 related to tol protein [Fusarium fujikuroi IMI 58289]SCN83379.1 related to tol protein [Fusarium fujikuroi]